MSVSPTGVSRSEGSASGAGDYHVIVAIFDAATGKRVTDAQGAARVESLGLGGQEKTLEHMPIAGALTYGNYFRIAGTGPYRISLRVARPGQSLSTDVRFEHRHQ